MIDPVITSNNSASNIFSASNILYMKNFGLFYVNSDADNQASNKLSKFKDFDYDITWINNDEILSNIIFPITFCFKEQKKDGSPLGCLNTTYSGFQALPDNPSERIGGVYYLEDDNTSAFFDENSIPEDLSNQIENIGQYISNTLFKNNIKIRKLNNESSED